MASSFLYRTQTAGTSTKKFTFSCWAKLSATSGTLGLFSTSNGWADGTGIAFAIHDSALRIYNGANGVGGGNMNSVANRLFRDNNAWYHFHFIADTDESTIADRLKVYVNGELQTLTNVGGSGLNLPAQGASWSNVGVNSETMQVGRASYSGSHYFDGYISHASFVDGTAVAHTSFGETDSTSGIWKFKSPSGVTWGTNGFHLKFENSAALGTDSSGNSNTFAVNGNLKQSLDTPSNTYATLNPNDVMNGGTGILKPTYSNGNLTMANGVDDNRQAFATISPETGKWYYEMKIDAAPSNGHRIGVFFGNNKTHNGSYYYGANAFYIHQNGQIYYNGSSTTYMSSYTAGDIISVALDVTNGNIYMSKNGGASDSTWSDGSGNNNQAFPGTSINGKLSASWISGAATPFFDVYGNGDKQSINFGNGFFGTTPISSAGSNGNGSLFEYDVPSGYYALNTKNINTYG